MKKSLFWISLFYWKIKLTRKKMFQFLLSQKIRYFKKIKTKENFNKKIYIKFKDIQLPLDYKRRKSQFIIKNDFKKKSIKRAIRVILNEII